MKQIQIDPDRDWLLDCVPRPAQIEALNRSFCGTVFKRHKDDEDNPDPLPHHGQPASGWGHFMEMRVGKTPTALNEYLLMRRNFGVSKAFVLAPSKYKWAWAHEAAAFGVDVPVFVYDAKKKRDFDRFCELNQREGVVIVNYEALIQVDNLVRFARWVDKKCMMMADESVMMKKPRGLFFLRAHALSKDAACTRGLTGLPAPQGPFDLWSQLRFCRQIEGFNFHAFKNTYCEMGGFQRTKVVGLRRMDELHDLLYKTSFIAKRADWGTRLDCDYERVKVNMMPKQSRAYKQMEKEFMVWLDSGDSISVDQVITKRMKMQQISSGFIYDEDGVPRELIPFNKTPKFSDLMERMETEISGKILIIAYYSSTMNSLVTSLKKFKPAVIGGNKLMKELGVSVEGEKVRFNNDPSCRVLVGQSKAIKYGHTLMGDKDNPCNTICYFENSYSLDDRAQSEERPQGEGQTSGIHIWDYYTSGIEREIIIALQRKKDVSEVVLDYYKR